MNRTENNITICEKGLEEYPKSKIVLGNLVMVLWVASGTIACWFLFPWLAWVYLALAVVMVGIVLRRLVCTNCYYYGKWCGLGWGKLAALFFKKGEIGKFRTTIGVKLAPITYGLLSLIPIIAIVIALILGFTIPKVIVLVVLLAVSYYSGVASRKKGCINCKMRLVCRGASYHE
jgi:hypothetical protein